MTVLSTQHDENLITDPIIDNLVGASVELRSAVMVDLDPEGTMGEVKAVRPGTAIINFILPTDDENSIEFFTNVRVLPQDDFSSVPDAEVTFGFVFKEVLRYYHFLYPVMNGIIDLSDEFQMSLRAQFIRDRIDSSNWDSSSYMPITRELSDGKRELLRRWCNIVLGV